MFNCKKLKFTINMFNCYNYIEVNQMKFRLESTKPSLDWDVEKDGAKEIKYDEDALNKDSYDYLFEDGELDRILAEMQSIDDYDRAILDTAKQPSDTIAKGFAESEMSDEELMALWDGRDLGKYTINTPTTDKNQERIAARGMEIFEEQEFKKAMDDFNRLVNDGDPIREETKAEIDMIMQQMALDW